MTKIRAASTQSFYNGDPEDMKVKLLNHKAELLRTWSLLEGHVLIIALIMCIHINLCIKYGCPRRQEECQIPLSSLTGC